MSNYAFPSLLYMSSPLLSVPPTTRLEEAYSRLLEDGISSLGVVDDGALVGAVSRTDLLRAGRREVSDGNRESALTLPPEPVERIMTRDVVTISPETPLADAARLMVSRYIHRVFVVENGVPLGVLSARDLMKVLEENRSQIPVRDYMTSPVFTIRDEEPLDEAVRRLDRAHVSGLVVVEEGWPVGVFGKMEALDARDLPGDTAIGDVMNPRVLVLPSSTSLHRAAGQARALGVRRVVLQDGSGIVGILSGLDFARAIS